MATIAIIVAAGKGTRFKGKKQFHLINRRPLVTYSLDAFEKNRNIARIILVASPRDITRCRKMVKKRAYRKVVVVAGGPRRQDSVRNAFETIRDRRGQVIVHDAARPAVSGQDIDAGIKECRKHRCVTLGIPVRDTLKLVLGGRLRTMDRDNLYQIQTPQFFDIGLLRTAYQRIDFSRTFTDETSIIGACGGRIKIIPGDPLNLKVTDRRDITAIRRLLS